MLATSLARFHSVSLGSTRIGSARLNACWKSRLHACETTTVMNNRGHLSTTPVNSLPVDQNSNRPSCIGRFWPARSNECTPVIQVTAAPASQPSCPFPELVGSIYYGGDPDYCRSVCTSRIARHGPVINSSSVWTREPNNSAMCAIPLQGLNLRITKYAKSRQCKYIIVRSAM